MCALSLYLYLRSQVFFHVNLFLLWLQAGLAANVKSVRSASCTEVPGCDPEVYRQESQDCMAIFDKWGEMEQVDFVTNLLKKMCHYQHGQINTYLKPMLQRDFISALPGW